MSWTEIGQFELSRDWQFTVPIAVAAYFRIRHLQGRQAFTGLIASSNGGEPKTLFNIRQITCKPQFDIYEFFVPSLWGDRSIAIRRADSSLNPWVVAIDVWDDPVPAPDYLTLHTQHLADVNPHPQYVLGNALYAILAERESSIAQALITDHEQTTSPHPQYATAQALTDAAAIIGQLSADLAAAIVQIATLNQALASKEDGGAAATAISSHTNALDPHPQYATDSEVMGAIATLNTAIVDTIASHTSAVNPHPQYLQATALKIRQSHSLTFTTGYSTNSTTFVDSGMQIALPSPPLPGSKVRVRFLGFAGGSTGGAVVFSSLRKGGTDLHPGGTLGFSRNRIANSSDTFSIGFQFEGQASADTYSVTFRATAGIAYLNRSHSGDLTPSTLTIEEILA